MTFNAIYLLIQWLCLGYMIWLYHKNQKKHERFKAWTHKYIELNKKAATALYGLDDETYKRLIKELEEHFKELD